MRANDRREGWSVPIDRIEAFTAGASMAVEVGAIEKELTALWRQAAERSAGSQVAVVRACLWNLIVHVSGEEEILRVKDVLDQVSHVVPTRIIALFEHADEAWEGSDDRTGLRAFVEANFRPAPGGRREVVAEEITLEAPRHLSRRLPPLVRSLLLPDLPIGLYLAGGPLSEPLEPLLHEAERLIIDTGRLDSGAALQAVGSDLIRHECGTTTEVMDLGWLRLLPWRLLLAAPFDDPAAQAELSSLSGITVRHAPGKEPTALLLLGWLMSRLSLVPAGRRVLRGPAGRPVEIDLREGGGPEDLSGTAGIAEVVLHCAGRVFEASAAMLPASRLRRESDLVIKALGPLGRDPLMFAALRACMALSLR
jgi:hypothetical protein